MADLNPQARLSRWLGEWAMVPERLDFEVSDLVQDSREASPGCAFLALAGQRSSADNYVQDALQRGARVVIRSGEASGLEEVDGALVVSIPQLDRVAGELVHRFFGRVSERLRIVGVTGTNGKSSVVHFIAQLAAALGVNAGTIGTLGYGSVSNLRATRHTTPPLVDVHRMLAELAAEGCEVVAMEVSSHALDQGRVDGIRFHTAVFTNLSRDHLDYHGSMEAYAEAKQKLFERPELRSVVLNQDDPWSLHWINELSFRECLRFGFSAEADLRAMIKRQEPGGLRVEVQYDGVNETFLLPLLGDFNVANYLAACGALMSLGWAVAEVLSVSQSLRSASGRLERVELEGAPKIVIDYAHTPDALEKALRNLRSHCEGSLWCVFGCGGDRDIGKRAEMGRVACSIADRVIVTDDNPRSEDPAQIATHVLEGCEDLSRVELVQPREKAILRALELAGEQDWVVVAGKGHEDYQEIAGVRYRFSDQDMVRGCWQALQSRRAHQNNVEAG